MRTDSVKKYVIPNIPYLFILWACLKPFALAGVGHIG